MLVWALPGCLADDFQRGKLEETQHLVTLGEPRDSSQLPLIVEAQLPPGLELPGNQI